MYKVGSGEKGCDENELRSFIWAQGGLDGFSLATARQGLKRSPAVRG